MAQEVRPVDDESIEYNDPPQMIWVRVRDAYKLIWVENIKHHDIGALMVSIKERGLQEIPKYDKALSAIKAGNGRVEALDCMEKEKYELPPGIASEKNTGYWVMPLLIGTDADSYEEAAAYAVDSNNTVMMGGGFSMYDISRLYDPDQYIALVEKIDKAGAKMVSLDQDDIQSLFRMKLGAEDAMIMPPASVANIPDMPSSPQEEDHWPGIKAKIRPDLYEVYLQITGEFGDTDAERIEGLLARYKITAH
jgi:hypothetical protein